MVFVFVLFIWEIVAAGYACNQILDQKQRGEQHGGKGEAEQGEKFSNGAGGFHF